MIPLFVLAAALAADPAPVPARVRVVAERDAVSDWLVGRLLEEGFTVTGADDAQIDLRLARTERTWELTADGSTSEHVAVPVDDDEVVARLELLHLAVGALDSVQPRVVDEVAVSSFALELSPALEPALHTAIEAELTHAVLDGGAALAPTRTSASFVLCAAFVDGVVDVASRGADESCPAVAASATTASVREQAVAVVAAALHPMPEPAVVVATPGKDDERAPLGDPEPPPPQPPRTWNNAPLVVRGGVGAGVLARGGETDALISTSLFIGREPGVSGWLDVQVWPGRRARADLFVLEVLPAAGVRVRAFTRGRISLDVGGLLGVQAHGYRFGEGDQRASGIAFDMSGECAIGVAIRLWREHELQLLLRGGRSTRDRRHVVETDVVWHRGTWRIGATAGLTFGRRLRR